MKNRLVSILVLITLLLTLGSPGATPAQAAPPAAPATLLHQWTFNSDGSDTVGGATADLLNGATVAGCQLNLNNTQNNYASLPISPSLNSLTDISVETWATLWYNNENWARLFDFGKGTSGYLYFAPRDGSGNPRFAIGSSTSEQATSGSTALAAGVPAHVVVTLDSATHTARLYLNNVLVATNTSVTVTPASLIPLTNNWLGRSQYDSNSYLNGMIDEFRVYSGVLTAAEVASHYASGSTPCSVSPLTGTISEDFDIFSPLNSNWVLLQNSRLASGWLHLTEASPGQVGNAVYSVPFSSSDYLDVEFDYAIYGGDGGDGLAFYLFDGSADPSLGSGGGNVGYVGLPNGYLGVGFTEYLSSNAVKLWGSDSGFNQLKAVSTVTVGGRPGKHARIVFKNNRIWVWLAGNLIIENYNLASAAGQKALPATLKFGFSGGTGYNTNTHEVDNLTVRVYDRITRVKTNGATTGFCGATWADVCDLQYALTNALYGDELWVAAGTYKPTTGTDRNATFQLKSGVNVYGGFAGTETARSQRQSSLYDATILSGELGAAGKADNSYHVVKGATGATLDGFAITGGNADSATSPNNNGGGMLNDHNSPTVTNVTFSGNSATYYGGGMYNNYSSPALTDVTFSGNSAGWGGGIFNDYSSPTVTEVAFSNNSATASGGGMYNKSDSNPVVTNVTFNGNSAATSGGGMYNDHSAPAVRDVTFLLNSATYDGGGIYNATYSNPAVTNVTFSGNSANHYGGGMYNDYSNPAVTNVTFSGNSATYNGGGMYNKNYSPQIRNTILWGNTATTGTQIYDGLGSTPTVTSSVVQGGYSGAGNLSADPKLGALGEHGGSTQTIPILFGSSAINKGDPAYCAAGKDQRGVSYVSVCDIGAYEYYYTAPDVTIEQAVGQPDPAAALPVNFTVSFSEPIEPSTFTVGDITQGGSATGVGWNITDSGDQKIFTLSATTSGLGTLIPSLAAGAVQDFASNGNSASASADNSVTLCANAITVTSNLDSGAGSLRQAIADVCAGGTITFNGDMTITLASQLPAVAKAITITGNGAANTIVQANAASGVATYRVFEVSAGGNLTLDGLTVQNGRCAGACATNTMRGSGVYNAVGGTLTVTNSTFSGNSSSAFGGGIHNSGTLTVTNSTFSGNAAASGGGVFNYGTLTVTNSTFSGNFGGVGGAVRNYYGTLTVTNSTFSGNIASQGGGIYNDSALTVTNSIFSGNSGSTGVGGIYNYSGTLTVTNSTFSDNFGGGGTGGGIGNRGTLNMANSTLIGNISDNGAGLGTGGGFQNDYGTATLTNVTISGNQARGASDDGGGGVMVYGGTVNLINSTISGNSASSASGGGGISQLAPGKVTLTNVISAGNTSTASKPDLSGAYTSNGNNLIGSTDGSTGLTNGVNGDLAGTNAAPVNALLGLLGNHGGITQTVPLLPGSPAIDAGNDSICAASPVNSLDQRGVARPKGIHCDIGSVEMDTATFHAVSGNISAGGVGVDGVTLSYGQSTTATDSNGDYSFQVYDGWTGAVTPSKDGYVFTPISKTYATPVTTNLPGENYTATNGVTISGQVSLSGMGVEGATLTYGVGLSTLTGSDGKYLFTVPLGWSGTVTPSKAGSTFLPSEKTYISLAAHQADQDYAATLVDYTLTITSVHGAVTNNPAQVTYHYGDLVELTPVAESGWHFLEWTGDLTGSSAPGSLLISGDASVTATFSNTYTLTYAPGEHGSISGVSPQTVVQGADGSPVTAMPETGYHFVDWSDGSTSNPRTDTNVTADVSVTANFALNSYTVTFDPQGGAAVPSQTVDHGGLVSKPADQTRTGYIFGGWYDASTGGNLWDFASGTVTANTTLFARWNANTYTVTFNAQGGSTVPSQNVDYGGFATQPVDPSLADYTFGGWYDAASGGAAWDFANNAVTANQTLYAQWMLNAYTVTFDPQGGSAVSSQSVSHGSLVTEPIDPTRPGYTFAGWFNGASAWDFANDTITANTTLYAQWMLNAIPALTSFTRQTPATSPTNADTLVFRATFSEDVQNVDTGDFAISGTTAGLSVATVSASVYDITITGGDLANLNGTVGLNLTGGQNIQDLTGNALPAGEPATDETYEVNNLAPLVASTNLSVSYAGAGPSSFIVVFNENVKNASGGTGNDDASNPANYVVIEQGSVSGFQTAACNSIDAAQDARVFPSGVTYIPNTAIVNLGSALPVGSYRLFICGTTSIVDLAGNHLNNGVDTTFDFAVSASAGDSGTNDGNSSDSANTWSLPKTGFAPNMVTRLPEQPATLAYTKMSDLWLEIPSQGVKANIVGVPQSENIWDVKWLGNDAGWLNGTAFPSWEGNSVVTGHVMGADGLPGPFAKLQDLQYGEQIIVHMLDQQYIFEIRNKRLARPDSTAFAFEHLEDASYLTLVTCSGYNKESDTYSFRRIIRAVLVSVK